MGVRVCVCVFVPVNDFYNFKNIPVFFPADVFLLMVYLVYIIEGILEVKLPTIWTDEKQSRAEGERRERLEERRSEKRKSQKREDADARKGRKVAKHCVFFSNDLWLRRVEK